jgi:hypothetical protein
MASHQKLAAVLITLVTFWRPVASIGAMCAQVVYGNFYDLGNLKSDTGYSLDISNQKGKILFNMCQFSTLRCPGYNDSIAVYKSEDMCVPLTSASTTQGFNSSLLVGPDQKNNTAGLNMSFAGLVKVDPGMGNSSTNYSLQLLLTCDQNITDYVWDDPLPVFNSTNGSFVVYGRGPASCPKVSGSFLVEFFQKFSYLTAIIAIIIGAIQCFYGFRLYRPTVFLLGFLLAFLVLVLFLFEIWTGPDSPSYKGYIIVAFAVVSGILFGFLVAAIAWVAIVVSGAILGFFLSTFLYTLALYRISSKPSNLLFYNILVIGMVLGSIAAYEFQSAILIVSCSFTGAYLLIRGVSVFIGGFPSELELAFMNQTGTDDGSRSWDLIYLGSIVVLTLAGIFVQQRLHFADLESEKQNDLMRKMLHRGVDEVEAEVKDSLVAKDKEPIEMVSTSPMKVEKIKSEEKTAPEKMIPPSKVLDESDELSEPELPVKIEKIEVKASPAKEKTTKVAQSVKQKVPEPESEEEQSEPEPPIPEKKSKPVVKKIDNEKTKIIPAAKAEETDGEDEEEELPKPIQKIKSTGIEKERESPITEDKESWSIRAYCCAKGRIW